MNAHVDDLPLQLLKQPVTETLQQMRQLLAAYLEQPGEVAFLTELSTHSRQIRAVLVLLNEDAAAGVVENLLLLLQRMQTPEVRNDTSLDVLSQVVLQTTLYFEWLQLGIARPEFDLMPLQTQLHALCHDEPLPLADAHSASALKQLAPKLRPMLQRALLGMLRKSGQNLEPLADVFGQLYINSIRGTDKRLWSLAQAVTLELNSGDSIDSANKLLLRETEKHLDRLLHDIVDRSAEADLERRLRQYLGSTASGVARLQQLFPNIAGVLLDSSTLQQTARLLQEEMIRIENTLDRFIRDNQRQELLHSARQRVQNLAHILTLLNVTAAAQLAQQQADILQQWLQLSGPNKSLTHTDLLPLASVLVLIQGSLNALPELVYETSSRISSDSSSSQCYQQQLVVFEQRRVRQALGRETHKILAEIRSFVSQHLELEAAPDWQAVLPLLNQLRATYQFLDCPPAVALLQQLSHTVAELGGAVTISDTAVFLDGFADITIVLEHTLQNLSAQRTPDSAMLSQAQQQWQALQMLLVRQTTSPEYHSITMAETMTETMAETMAETMIDDRIVDVKNGELPASSANADLLSDAGLEVVDQEILIIFLEELQGEADSLQTQTQQWRVDPGAQEPITTIKRSFHTIKGSARLIGANNLGEFASQFEQLLSHLSEDFTRVQPAVFDAIDAARLVLHNITDIHSLGNSTEILVRVAQHVAALIQNQPTTLPDVGQWLRHDVEPEPESEPEPEQVLQPFAFTPTVLPDDIDLELVQVYIAEASDILDNAEILLQRWSVKPQDQELLNDLRRDMHTLKGSSRMVGLMSIGDLGHAMESIFDGIVVGRLVPNTTIITTLQDALDTLNGMLSRVKDSTIPAPAVGLINEINALLDNELGAEASSDAKVAVPEAPVAVGKTANIETIRVASALLNNLVNQSGESNIFRARVEQGVNVLSTGLGELEQTVERLYAQLRRLEIQTETQILFRREEGHDRQDFDPLELDRFSELQQLSRSMLEMVDDLTNVRNGLEDQSQSINFLLDQQAKVQQTIQQGLMQTRVVPFANVMPRLRRVVRQAARELGKSAELQLHGSETDIDRSILDNIIAPLEHMLRNALTHGVEIPAKRRAAGKSELSIIHLALNREGAELVLTLSDDGAGINFDAIRSKGEKKGLFKPGELVGEQALLDLLLQPGFSTASQVTALAGRGVGLDVLNDAIKGMRGALQINSEAGRGTTFIIRLPFSLALTQALLVKVGTDTFAVPLLSIQAVGRLSSGDWRAYLDGKDIQHRYGGEDYPLYSLGFVFGTAQRQQGIDAVRPAVLLFRSAEAAAALQVDAILGSQEIIVKPISPQLVGVPSISGATVLNDGSVVVVLELASLVRHINPASGDAPALERMYLGETQQPQRIRAMIVDDSITMRKVTARALERHNMDAILAKDGVEAVTLLEEQTPDIILLDIEMPRMDGFEVAGHIRNQPHLQGVPILMVTSRSGDKHRERATRLGVNDYLIKPYQEEELMVAINQLLKQPTADTSHD